MRDVRDARLPRLHVRPDRVTHAVWGSSRYLPHCLLHAHALQAQLATQVQRSPSPQRHGFVFWVWFSF